MYCMHDICMWVMDPYGLIRPVPAQTHTSVYVHRFSTRAEGSGVHRRGQARQVRGARRLARAWSARGMTSARGWLERHGLWRSALVQHTVYCTTQAVGTACVAKVRPVDVRVSSYRCKRHWPRTHAHKAPTQSSMHAHMHKDNHARTHLTRTHTPCMQTPFVLSRCTCTVLSPLLAAHLNASLGAQCLVHAAVHSRAVLCRRLRRRGRR